MSWKIEEYHSSFTIPNEKMYSGLTKIETRMNAIANLLDHFKSKRLTTPAPNPVRIKSEIVLGWFEPSLWDF